MTSLTPDAARRALDELVRAHLLTEQAPGRFGFHDLLRAYADQLRAHEDEREDALRRMRRLPAHRPRRRPAVDRPRPSPRRP